MYWPNVKFVALPVPKTIGGTQKLGSPSIRPQILMGFCSEFRMDPVNLPAKFEVRIALPVSEKMAIGVLGGGCEPRILGKRRPYGVRDGTV